MKYSGKILLMVLVLNSWFITPVSYAGFIDGYKLIEWLQEESKEETSQNELMLGYGNGFVIGVLDSLVQRKQICIPEKSLIQPIVSYPISSQLPSTNFPMIFS